MRARTHFNEDIVRAQDLWTAAQAPSMASGLAGDVCRHSVAAAVAAMDAYLCDAYVDVLAGALARAKAQPASLPPPYGKVLLPAGPLLSAYNQRPNWAFRMAARELMDKDNMLQIRRVPDMFNPALPQGQKIWADLMPKYLALNRKRLTHYDAAGFAALAPGVPTQDGLKKARSTLINRIGTVVQRRHDIVHNCDRPKQAITPLTMAAGKKMIADVRSFVEILDAHLELHRLA